MLPMQRTGFGRDLDLGSVPLSPVAVVAQQSPSADDLDRERLIGCFDDAIKDMLNFDRLFDGRIV